MCGYTAGRSGKSPDRLDALVWAVTDLLIDAVDRNEARVRTL